MFVKITENVPPTKKEYTPCCTWQDESSCEDCSLKTDLDCRWELKHLLRFLYVMSPALLIAFGAIIVGAIFTSGWWRLGALTGYYAIFFIIETRILCSHCPYYSEKGIILHCLANHGFIKYCRYHPEPMNLFERTLLIIGITLFAVLPLLAQVPSIIILSSSLPSEQVKFIVLLVLLGLSLIAIIFGFTFLFTRICISCVNLSCPFNRVPDDLAEKYLNKNPDMKQAWLSHSFEESSNK